MKKKDMRLSLVIELCAMAPMQYDINKMTDRIMRRLERAYRKGVRDAQLNSQAPCGMGQESDRLGLYD